MISCDIEGKDYAVNAKFNYIERFTGVIRVDKAGHDGHWEHENVYELYV
jgi:hypothetical protein